MALTRFYRKRRIESGQIRGVRDLLQSRFDWGLAKADYALFYPSEYYSVEKIGDVDEIVEKRGQPLDVRVGFVSQSGQILNIESRGRDPADQRMHIEAMRIKGSPEKLLDAVQSLLAVQPIDEVPSDRQVKSAFIAHIFSDDGHAYANELARFLDLLGTRCESGRAFAPKSVSEKVVGRLARHDVLMAIASPHDDFTWLSQEIATAAALGKSIFVLKEDGVSLKEGILGDHEYIQFPRGQLSKAFIPILEGLAELRGDTVG